MSSQLSATQVAFLLVALIQAVFAIVWAIGAHALVAARSAIRYWIAWAALSAITWLILSMNVDEPPLLAMLAGCVAIMSLQRGIRTFIGRPHPDRAHALLLLASVAIAAVSLAPERRPLQAAGNYAVLAVLYGGIAVDLYRHARDPLRFDWPIVLALPVLLGSVAFGVRVVRAIVQPESVAAQMATDSLMNVQAAMIYVTLVLSLHATLMVLVVARLVGELRRLSRHDGLTGLLNRRAMEELLEAQIRRSRSGAASFVLMMIDLDHFKRINDQHGHPVGDRALKHVAALLQDAMPAAAALARYGGEEFIVLFPGVTSMQAEQLAERLRNLLATNALLHGSVSIPMSMSIGVAQWRGAADDLSQLLLRADAALFQAKVQGRNRVVIALDSRGVQPVPA
ncbi:MAG TPA: GGDEF domain-containing protein [Povalibacter sp.]|uniref:GGDEF domain-containing protein n=1 Tax=Povalibacter sp. TaxID=1962978 RepID=UPI002CEDBAC5|nr:GGDEF domain-containing protein [Povalibacter sp.]HMN45366.1 GGDEF domain-containing protein [Povalibacter sp.]